MRIEPEGVLLLVKPDPIKDKTDGGIYLAETTKDREERESVTGSIEVMGPAVQLEFNDGPAKVGDHIQYAKYAGYVMKDGVDIFRLIDHKDVLARVG